MVYPHSRLNLLLMKRDYGFVCVIRKCIKRVSEVYHTMAGLEPNVSKFTTTLSCYCITVLQLIYLNDFTFFFGVYFIKPMFI